MNQWKLEANTRNRRQARENACDQVTIGFVFASDWLSRWSEIFKPIAERSKAKPKQVRITFDTQLKTALFYYITPQHYELFPTEEFFCGN